jgi:hypothetical protein
MSLNIFLIICILGIDFMIYVLFQWIFGDKRKTIARQVALTRQTLSEQSLRPYLVASQHAERSKGIKSVRHGRRREKQCEWHPKARFLPRTNRLTLGPPFGI